MKSRTEAIRKQSNVIPTYTVVKSVVLDSRG